MSEQNKTISRRILEEAFTKGDFSVIDECVAPHYVDHDPANPPGVAGPAGLKQMVSMYRSAFPDLRMSIDEQIAEGERVVTRWRARGTHKGTLAGRGATGRTVHVTGITIDRIVNGRLVESWSNWDTAGLMQQLGSTASLQPQGDGRRVSAPRS